MGIHIKLKPDGRQLRVHVTCHIGELVVVGQAFVDVALCQTEEFVGQFGFRALEQVETGFLEGEVFEFGFRGLGVEFERIGVLVGRRAIAIQRPVTAVDGVFDAILGLGHVDAVCDAGAVGDDEGRAFVFFGFLEGLEGLVAVGAEGDGGLGRGDRRGRHRGQLRIS